MKRVAIYTRISTDETNQPYSLEAQQQRLNSYVALQDGWRVVRKFEEQASGGSLERPQLRRALAEARARRFDILLVYRLDRLTRSSRDLFTIVDELNEGGVELRSATEPVDLSSPVGRLMVQMLSNFAEFERETIRDRITAGLERKAARGEWVGGRPPFGYTKIEGGLVAEPAEAAVVRLIFERYAQGAEGSVNLAWWLNDRGYRTRQGRRFSPKTVLGILSNPIYVGRIRRGDETFEGKHEAILDEQTFESVQETLRKRGDDPRLRRSNQSDYLLTSLVKCGRCGSAMIGMSANGRGGRYGYYACHSRRRRKECDAEFIPARELDREVLAQLQGLLRQDDVLAEAVEEAVRRAGAVRASRDVELAELATRQRELEQRVSRYFDHFESGVLEADVVQARLTELRAQLAGVQARQDELAGAANDVTPLTREDVAELARSLGKVLSLGTPPQKKKLVAELVEEVRVVNRSDIRPSYRFPAVRPPSPSVERAGIEPATSALQRRRSPS